MLKNLAISLAKLSGFTIKTLRQGNASSLPGRLALKAYPQILKSLSHSTVKSQNKFIVTGTNGKTTTTGILKQILIESGVKKGIICNDLGANLYYGVTTAFINASNLLGQLKSSDYVIEADEAALSQISQDIEPEIITVTNLYRDQLDRFGELDTTQKLINKGIDSAQRPLLVLNLDDVKVSQLGTEEHRKIFYTVTKNNNSEALIKDFDSKLSSNANANIEADIKAEILEESHASTYFKLASKSDSIEIMMPLPGIYNVYNACAAATAAYSKGISLEHIKAGIENYQGNFGRAETKTLKGIETKTFLIKNPTGATEVLKILAKDTKSRFLIIINDNYADGRDVSWLWDADFEQLKQEHILSKTIYTSGKRAYDMAARLKYAGLEKIECESSIKEALEKTLDSCHNDERLYILPTYTSLLELEKLALN